MQPQLLSKCVVEMWVSISIRRAPCPSYDLHDSYMKSIELSGISPRGGIFPGIQDGGSIPLTLGEGSTFSLSSILSAEPSQLIWKRVTRGLEAKIFLWSYNDEIIKIEKCQNKRSLKLLFAIKKTNN